MKMDHSMENDIHRRFSTIKKTCETYQEATLFLTTFYPITLQATKGPSASPNAQVHVLGGSKSDLKVCKSYWQKIEGQILKLLEMTIENLYYTLCVGESTVFLMIIN